MAGANKGMSRRFVLDRVLGREPVGQPPHRLFDESLRARFGWSEQARTLDAILRQMRGAKRDYNVERRSLSGSGVDANFPAVKAHQLLNHRQPDSGAFVGSADLTFDTMEALEQARYLMRRDAGSRVAHGKLRACSVEREAERDADFTCESIFERIGEQIEDDLLPHITIDVSRFRQGPAINHEAKPGLVHRRTKGAGEFRTVTGEVGWLVHSIEATRFNSREVEQRVDESQQAKSVAMDQLDFVARGGDLAGAAVTPEQIFQWAQHQGERRTKLVAGVGKERGLGPVDLSERLGALLFFFVSANVGQAGGNLPSQQIDESAIVVVDEYLFRSREHFAYRPWLADAGLNDGGSGGICRIDSGVRDEVRPRPVRIDEVDQAERKIVEVSADAAANRGEQLIQFARVCDLRGRLT